MGFLTLTLLSHLRRGRVRREPRAIAAAQPILYGHLPGSQPEGGEADIEELELAALTAVVQGVRIGEPLPVEGDRVAGDRDSAAALADAEQALAMHVPPPSVQVLPIAAGS